MDFGHQLPVVDWISLTVGNEVPLIRVLVFKTIEVGETSRKDIREFDEDGDACEVLANEGRNAEASRGSPLKPMLEGPQSDTDGDRATVDTVLRSNDTVRADITDIAGFPAMKVADVCIALGPIPLVPRVGGRGACCATDYPYFSLAMVHDDDKEVAAVQDCKHNGHHRGCIDGWQGIVVSELRNDPELHVSLVLCRIGPSIPVVDEVGRKKPHGAVELTCPAIVKVEVDGGQLYPNICT